MRAQTGTSIAARAKNNVSFSEIINSPTNRALLEKTLNDSKRVTRLVATLVSAVADSDGLRKCKPETIISSALKGEANNLSLSLGQFYLVPFGNVCTYIPSHKGYIQLAIRTGLYEDLDVFEIREGEYKGRNNRTGRPTFEFEPDEDKRELLPIVGYYAFFELKTGFTKGFYWPMTKILKHADRYSKAFDLRLYKKYKAGEKLDADEQRQIDNGPWYGKTGAQDAMCKKTVIKALLNSGYAPLSSEMVSAMSEDADEDLSSGFGMTYNDPADEETESANTDNVIDAEIIEEPKSKSKRNEISVRDAFFGGKENDDNSAK